MKTKTIVLSLLLIAGVNTHAQKQLSVRTSILVPTSTFAGGFDFNGFITDDMWGHAGVGLSIGFEYHHPLTDKGLNFYTSLDLFRNGLKSLSKTNYRNSLDIEESIKFSTYYNIPLSLGLHYKKELSETFSLYGLAGPSVNFLKISKATYTYDPTGSYSFTALNTFQLAYSLGIRVEVGVTLKGKYNIGIGYNALGRHSIGSTIQVLDSDGDSDGDTYVTGKSITLVNLKFGINI